MDLLRAVPILTVTDVDAQFSVMDKDRSAPCNPEMSLEVQDVDDAYRLAQASGAEIVHLLQDEDWGVRRFFLRTSSGQVVNVLSHRA
ncbi:hypothetical protein ACJ5H2_12665 [Nocardioides sp. R1-1]|uniref:hypothetical protein n=1 Tax=Nocardioides sp. R1-1 TaxID=3383502 RepID=UPI0038D03969